MFPLDHCLNERWNCHVHHKNSVPPGILYQAILRWNEVWNRTYTWTAHDSWEKYKDAKECPQTLLMLPFQSFLLLLKEIKLAVVKSAKIVWLKSSKWIVWCLDTYVFRFIVFVKFCFYNKASLVYVEVWLGLSHYKCRWQNILWLFLKWLVGPMTDIMSMLPTYMGVPYYYIVVF